MTKEEEYSKKLKKEAINKIRKNKKMVSRTLDAATPFFSIGLGLFLFRGMAIVPSTDEFIPYVFKAVFIYLMLTALLVIIVKIIVCSRKISSQKLDEVYRDIIKEKIADNHKRTISLEQELASLKEEDAILKEV